MKRVWWTSLLVTLVALVVEIGYPIAAMAYRLRTQAAPAVEGVPGTVSSCAAQPDPAASGAYPQCRASVLAGCSVAPGSGPSAAFARYAAATRDGWTGGDSTYSIALPDGRIVWVFSDTFLGPLNPDGTRPVGALLVNNTFVVQDGTRLTTVDGGTAARPAAIMPPAGPGRWYWAGDGMLAGDGSLQVVFREYRRTGPGNWDFTFSRSVVATFSTLDLRRPASVDALPSATGVAWGAALLPAARSGDGYTYVYGVRSAATGKAMRIARVPGSDLRDGPWQYRTSCGWSTDESAGTDVMTGVADEFSVTPWRGRYVLVTTDGTGLGDRIEGFAACTPYGPFTGGTTLYRMPELAPRGEHAGTVIAYNAHAHPELSSGDTLLVSYNVNTLAGAAGSGGDVYRDPGIYRPRFVELRLLPSST